MLGFSRCAAVWLKSKSNIPSNRRIMISHLLSAKLPGEHQWSTGVLAQLGVMRGTWSCGEAWASHGGWTSHSKLKDYRISLKADKFHL